MPASVERPFPLFRSNYFSTSGCASETCFSGMEGLGEGGAKPLGEGRVQQSHLQRPNLRKLDLKSLSREDNGPASETQLRRQKYQLYEKQCSQIVEGLFLAGDTVARNREQLRENKITHVLNCVGFVCKEYFKEELVYRTYYLQDTPSEDILAVLYDALEFIDDALRAGGRVLVHCSQGVSRSATIVIAYIMWKSGRSYDEVFAQVKEARGVANPNIGFTCQLLQWQKRRQLPSPSRTRMYRIAPHCAKSPLTLVAKNVPLPKQYASNTFRELDHRGSFVVHAPGRIYVWIGCYCPPAIAAAARHHAKLLLKYEHPQLLQRQQGTQAAVILEVRQGAETSEFMGLLDPPRLDAEAVRLHSRRTSLTEELAAGSAACCPAPSTSLTDFSVAETCGSVGASPVLGLIYAPSRLAQPSSGSSPLSMQAAGIMTPRQYHHPRTNTNWVIDEVEDYSLDYEMYQDALYCTQPGATVSEGGHAMASVVCEGLTLTALRTTTHSSPSMGVDAPATLGGLPLKSASRLLDSLAGRPESPATAEGRMRKYRRSGSELRIAVAPAVTPMPSLHISIEDDEMM